MGQIDYYLSLRSPYCYLANGRLEEIAARRGAEVRYRPVDLGQLRARTGGQPPGDLHPSRQAYRLQDMARVAASLGLAMEVRPMHEHANPAPASFAVIAAQEAGSDGDVGALVRGLLRAVWAEGRDIADDEVIGDCLEAAGFDRSLTISGMLAGAEAYSRNLEDAVSAGVFGVPFYVTGDDGRFFGQDRLTFLDRHLEDDT